MDPNYPDQKLEPVLDYTPLPQTSPPKSKSKLPLIIIGIFLLLLMGSGSYLLTKKAKESKKTAEPVPTRKIITPTLQVAPKLNDETVNWEMISNKEYSFRVPESIRCNGCYSNDEVETRITGNEWTIKVNKIEGKYLPLNSQFTYSTVDIFFNDFLTMQIGQNKTVSSNSLNRPTATPIPTNPSTPSFTPAEYIYTLTRLQDKKVNGLNGKFFDVKTINNKSNNPYFEKIAVVKKGDSYHSIVFGFNDKKNQDLFDKILSTFKFTTPEQTSNSNFTKEKLDLYNISINIPPGWSVKEMNRRPEPTASSAYQPKGHDCADYVIQDESRKANLLLKPTCSFGDGGPIEWPDNTDIVKELDSKGKVLLRIFDDRSNNYKYVIGYKPQNGATKGTYGDILSVPFDQSEGQNLIFMSVLLTYSGEASQKENYLKLTDDIIASLRKD